MPVIISQAAKAIMMMFALVLVDAVAQSSAKRPNVIILLTDDQGHGDLSCHGNPVLKTPSLDRLYDESVRLTDFHVAPMCKPTQGQLLTGVDAKLKSKLKPNVVFILADDQRHDTVGALGNSEIKTPNLDQLVKRGFAFNNAYCQGGMFPAVCLPSRTMIFTGRSTFRTPDPRAKTYDGPTLARSFNEAGYRTLYAGKRGNSFLPGMAAFSQTIYSQPNPQVSFAQQPGFVVEQAIKFIKNAEPAKPFLVFLAPPCPHDPREAPQRFHDMYNPETLSLSPNFAKNHPFDNGAIRIRDEKLAAHPRSPDEMKRHLADYYACITSFDHQIGRLVETLKAEEQWNNTIIVFTSDQGLAVGGRHGLMGKQNLYEHFKSPLILAGPGVGQGQSDALVYLHDLYPTLCELADIPTPEECEGQSLAKVVQGQATKVRESLFAVYIDFQRMVRDERWKLIWYPKANQLQLFDLAHDPWELTNLANSPKPEHTVKLSEMKMLMTKQRQQFGDKLDLPIP